MAGFSEADRFLLARAADHLIEYPWQCFWYGDTVGFEGLLAASALLGDPRYAAFAQGFIRGWVPRAAPYRECDDAIPGEVMCRIAASTGDAQIRQAVIALAEFLLARRRVAGLPVTIERAPLRIPPVAEMRRREVELLLDPGAGVFVDCLQMGPPLYAALGRLTGDSAYRLAALEEAATYSAVLQDDGTNLFHHFYLENTGRPYVLGWSRGQGWALLGLLSVYEMSEPGDPHRVEVGNAAQRLASAMLALQRPDGHWWAVAQEPESKDEYSTAAFMATAFWRGIRMGLLAEHEFATGADLAWDATWRGVDERGVLGKVSAAVYCSTEPAYYHHVPVGHIVPWGQGPLLMAAAERQVQAADLGTATHDLQGAAL